MGDLNGQMVKGYELLDLIGKGGFGAVYRAYQPLVEREVAIKIILPQYANHPDFIRRFEAEAQLVARLEHIHIVPLYDYWREPDSAYLVMRYLRGGSLRVALEQGPWEIDAVVRLMDQITAALAMAHSNGVIHRDIKPENILLDEESNAYLTDFGISKVVGRETTESDQVSGSLAYASPEQLQSRPVSPQSDIYGLGVVLYELLTAHHPFEGDTISEIVVKHLNAPLPDLQSLRPDLPEALNRVVQKATAKDPTDRYTDAREVAAALRMAVAAEQVVSVDWEIGLAEVVNPYKGLRAFEEADAADFFGREALTAQLLARLAEDDPLARFLAVVGPSGSGKSSVVYAGLLPALRGNALPGSGDWFVVDMAPGETPLQNLEAALLSVALKPPAHLFDQLRADPRGLLWAVENMLSGAEGDLLLIIDQLEELFTLVEDEAERAHFLELLHVATTSEHSRIRVIITLRADFYDRPLLYERFGALIQARTQVVLPLTAEEIERAIAGPAERIAVRVDPELIAAIVADVREEPGALPLLQYALTEVFERRDGRRLTLAAYQASGGVVGALARRAEEIYTGLDAAQQTVTRQMFLRLVTLGEGTEDTRRRARRAELAAIASNKAATQVALDAFGRYRLLTFDSELGTREPTVEMGHEALIREWARLREWLDESRDDIRLQRLLAAAAAEWRDADRDVSFLLSGARLAQFEEWAADTDIALTQEERACLGASVVERERQEAAERERQAREAALEKRARRVLQVLVGVFLVAAVTGIGLALLALDRERQAQDARATSDANAAIAAVAQGQALDHAATAIVAQGEALQQAATATYALGESEQRGTAVAEQAAAAETARADAENQATAVAEERDRAEVAEAAALNQAGISRSIALAAQAQLELAGPYPERAVLLGLEAIENYPYTWQAERALSVAVRESRVRRILYGHMGPANSAVWSPDGARIVTAGIDGTAKVWDATTGAKLLTFSGHTGGVNRAAWSPAPLEGGTGGARIVTAGEDGTAKVWDATTGAELLTLDGHTDELSGVAWSPDGARIVTASWDGTAKVWDATTGAELLTLDGRTVAVYSAAWSPDGARIVTTNVDETAKVWDATTGAELLTLVGHTEPVYCAAWSPDMARIVTASSDGAVKMWDAATGAELFPLAGHTDWVWTVAWSPDGTRIVTASWDGTAKVWDATTGAQLLNLASHTEVYSAAWSPDGTRIVTADGFGMAKVWDASIDAELLTLSDRMGAVYSAAWSPDGTRIVTASVDRAARVWDAATGDKLLVLTGHTQSVNGAAWSPDGARIVTASTDGTAKVWDATTGAEILTLSGHTDWVWNVAWSPAPLEGGTGEARIVTASRDGTAKVWLLVFDSAGEAATGMELFTLSGHTDGVKNVAWSPDGTRIVTASHDGTAKVWDATAGTELLTLSPRGAVTSAVWSPDGTHIVTTSLYDTPKVWDATTGAELLALSGHTDWVWGAAWSPGGTRIVTASGDRTARVWDAATGVELLTLSDHTDDVQRAMWSPDGTRIVTASSDGTAKVWRVWETTQDLIDYARGCCAVRELTNEERAQFGLPTLEGSPPPTNTPRPTRTPLSTLSIWPTPTVTPTLTPPPTSPPIVTLTPTVMMTVNKTHYSTTT